MAITEQKYNKWKVNKKLEEWGQYEIYHKRKKIVLINTGLKELPDWIKWLKRLEVLNLNGNSIREIPRWIGELKELKKMNIVNNNIQKIPTETIKNCDSLHTLWLGNNPIPQKEIEKAKKELNINII